ncbi:CRISPR-associated endonuclease Cas1 [Sulfuricystis multivorans]|uniref:CRISPR-associated endonuclease Cas1 n=1 Tax=Sulfuricystis multivorans TaxID=2211108 RepID=UPI000F82E764|nr:CRISPR-associated endonuclease Cas1 [Sulfuricystis multivorans]
MSSLFVDRRGAHLELESGAIVFRENGERIGTVPIAPLTRVFLRGEVTLSASLLGKLGEQGVGVVILSGRRGKPSLLLARPHNDAARRVAQIEKSLDASFCLTYARALIERKIDHQIEWFDELRSRDMQARYELTHAMQLIAGHKQRLPSADSLARLRGIEGSAAACYFDGLKAVVPESWQFKSRNRRPPKDPFNALLSLTYTLAHAELAIALYGAGFDPYVGFYHALDFGRESLAADLLEALRPLCDRFCLRLVKKQTLSPRDDFSTTENGCLLGKAGRARYYAAYEEYSEVLRAGIQAEVETLAERVGHALEAPVSAGQAHSGDGE